MKLYRRLIKPVLYYPGQSCEPKKRNLEDPAVWYPEEEQDALLERFKDLNNTFNTVGFDEQYIEYASYNEMKNHFSYNVPDKCKDCKCVGEYSGPLGGKFYCHLKSVDLNNIQQDISTFYVDPETRPEWCPMEKMNKDLDAMDPEKREQFDKIAEGLSLLFGAASAWKKEERSNA